MLLGELLVELIWKPKRMVWYLRLGALALAVYLWPGLVMPNRISGVALSLILLYALSHIAEEWGMTQLEKWVKRTPTSLDDKLLPIVKQLISAATWAIGITIILSYLGVDVSAIVTSLGIGGIALALASQELIKNFFGGLMLIMDGTFQVGDRIKIGSLEGKVIGISLRTIHIQLDDGSVAHIPNSQLLKNTVIVMKGHSRHHN